MEANFIGRGEPRLDTLGSSPQPTGLAPLDTRQCVFCREEIQLSASLCPHCRSNLVPLQWRANHCTALEQRIAVLEQTVGTLRLAPSAASEIKSGAANGDAAPSKTAEIKWPHMVDNIFLGLLSAPKIVASVAAIALSHFAGSSLAHTRQLRADRAASIAATRSSDLLPHLQAAQIKTTAETVKALYEAAAPIAAGTAAIWAAFNHFLL